MSLSSLTGLFYTTISLAFLHDYIGLRSLLNVAALFQLEDSSDSLSRALFTPTSELVIERQEGEGGERDRGREGGRETDRHRHRHRERETERPEPCHPAPLPT